MGRLNGKSVFVTGAAGGIGRAAAQLFAAEGAAIVVSDIAEAEGEKTAALVREHGGRALFVHTDVTSEESVARAFARGRAAFGQITVLHNNAGGSSGKDGSLATGSLDEFWRVIRLDLFGTILCCRAAIAGMIEIGGGSIINMSSIVSVIGVPDLDFYTAAKGGISALTRSLALQNAPHRIRVNALAPGVTMTERILKQSGGQVDKFPLSRKQILGPAAPIDVANAALFLASDESASITGTILPVDGGASAW
jgi:NAD(P)-dependent dehydrogenase (short-subunit alcohol dehydrogenase family)